MRGGGGGFIYKSKFLLVRVVHSVVGYIMFLILSSLSLFKFIIFYIPFKVMLVFFNKRIKINNVLSLFFLFVERFYQAL